MDTLVTTGWLNEHLDDPDLVVLDCTVTFRPGGGFGDTVSGHEEYEAGHIAGAVYTASLQEWAADPDNPMVVGE